MKQSDTFRENAENCRHLAESAISEPLANRYRRMAEAWTALAEEQDWLDGEKALARWRKSSCRPRRLETGRKLKVVAYFFDRPRGGSSSSRSCTNFAI